MKSYHPHPLRPRLQNFVIVVVVFVVANRDNVRGRDDDDEIDDNYRVDDIIFLKKSLKLNFFNA